jgi:hypothetical protein
VRAHLDEETATLLLEVTVPANVELATRGDIQELRAELLLRLTGQIAELDRRLSGQIAGLTTRIGDFETDLTRRLYFRVVPLIGGMLAIATWLGRLWL